MTLNDAIQHFINAFINDNGGEPSPQNFKKYYVGITNDIARRQSEHNVEFITYLHANTVQAASNLKKKLGELGFDNGGSHGNGAADDTKYIYIYRKSPATIEHE